MKSIFHILIAIAATLFLHMIALIVVLYVSYTDPPNKIKFVEVGMIEEPVELEDPKTLEETIADRVNEQIANLMASANSEQSNERKSFSKAAERRMQEQVEQNLRDLEQSVIDELAGQRIDDDTIAKAQATPKKNNEQLKENYEWFNSSYNGAVTAGVDVPGREPLEVHIPGYLCKGGGTVVIQVTVNVNGEVISAEIDTQRSKVSDPCLVEEASRSALKSTFFAKSSAPKRSTGTITYRFVPQ